MLANFLSIFQRGKEAQSAAANTHLESIPTITQEAYLKLLQGGTLQQHTSYFYSPERALPHYQAQVLIQALYHTGATLINNNAAYTTQTHLLLDCLPSEWSNADEPNSALMQYYNDLPNNVAINGSHTANNSLKAAFIIKVGLDHLSPKNIFSWYQKLNENALTMTMNLTLVTFPDQSQFLNDASVRQLLHCYITNHLEDKFAYLSDTQKERLRADSNYFFILGKDPGTSANVLAETMRYQLPADYVHTPKAAHRRQLQG